MRPSKITVAPAALDRDGIAAAQQLAGAGELLLNGALSSGYDRDGICAAQAPTAAGAMTIAGALASGGAVVLAVPRRLVFYTVADESGKTFRVTGTDSKGYPLVETVTGPNATYGYTTGVFRTVTQVYASAATTGDVEVGTQGVGTFDIPRHLGLYCAGDMSGVTFTAYGTDRYGTAVSEAITGPNATTVAGSVNFKTITRITASGAVGTNTEAGSYSSFETQIIPLNRRADYHTLQLMLSSTKNFTIDIQSTIDDIEAAYKASYEAGIDFVEQAPLQAVAADTITNAYGPLSGIRAQVTSFLAGSFELTAYSR